MNANAVAVSSSAAPNVGVTSFENAAESSAIVRSNARVTMAAGNEPATSQPVIGHDTLPRRACAAAPPALVIAAKSRSVPTATGADTPKPKRQQRRHQRTATDASGADDEADQRAAENEVQVHRPSVDVIRESQEDRAA